MSNLEEHTVDTLSDFVALVERLKEGEAKSGNHSDFIFRGQPVDKPLRPRIARLKPKGDLEKIERLINSEFERLGVPFLEYQTDNEWDRLALAQHHGLPTRLLDWTYNSLAALWFCVCGQPIEDGEKVQDGVVWIFKTKSEDFIDFPTDESPFSTGKTRVFRPRSVTRRILAQTGVFTCHKRTKQGKFVSLETNRSYKKRLVKVRVVGERFAGIRDHLLANGVSRLALFPDLDGLAGHLEGRYFHENNSNKRMQPTSG